jgi:glycosyltransferase involved in cell wall biosynthesis
MFVSVYMPTKDRCTLLQRAVASVLDQTHREFELLIVNDGSSDGTASYLDDLAARDPRVRVFHHDTPGGAPRARNKAIREARGEWITGIDDDDEFLPGRLAAFVSVAQAYETSGVNFSLLYTQDLVVSPERTGTTRKPCCVELDMLCRQNFIGDQVFVRRADLIAAGLYDEDLPAWQDLDLNMRLVDAYGPARLIDVPLYRLYDDDRPDRISRKGKAAILAAFEIVAGKWSTLPPQRKQLLYLQVLSAHYGFPIESSDLTRYLSYGVHPRAAVRFVKRFRERQERKRA